MSDELVKLQREYSKETATQQSYEMKFRALRGLHDAFIFSREGAEADRQRQEMHVVLDAILDHSNRCLQLQRQMIEQAGG